MPVHAVTLELPDEVYQHAQRVAQATRRPVEEIVSDWIRPPVHESASALDHLFSDELFQVARDMSPAEHVHRLQELLSARRQRMLSEDEQREALALVEHEDSPNTEKGQCTLSAQTTWYLARRFGSGFLIDRGVYPSSSVPSYC